MVILCKGRKSTRDALLEQLAKEDTQVLALAFTYAKHLLMYGEDITKAIATATQNKKLLEKAYQKGYYDGRNGKLRGSNADITFIDEFELLEKEENNDRRI